MADSVATPHAGRLTAVEAILRRLREYPELCTDQTPDSVSVHPVSPTGFTVSLYQHSSGYSVSFEGWHEEFQTEEDALNCFAFGLSDECRLRVLSRGGFDYRWILQFLEDGEWHDESETGLLLFPFWRRREERILQNHSISRSRI